MAINYAGLDRFDYECTVLLKKRGELLYIFNDMIALSLHFSLSPLFFHSSFFLGNPSHSLWWTKFFSRREVFSLGIG